MEYLAFGKINTTIGLKGEVKVYVTSSFVDLRLQKGYTLYIKSGNQYIPYTVEHAHFKGGNFYAIQFKEVTSIDEAEKLKGFEIFSIKDENDLLDDEYFYSDLIGLKVINEDKIERGTIVNIEEFPAQLTLKVEYNKKFYYVPFNDFFVPEVNLKEKFVLIHEIEGLII